ncbi:EamA family transporter [Methanospirillum hungatei]|uniref:EamA family transporter n=1 Tax=Methanospirillum hungatei TaxID=2203 RepID=UPI00064EA086|nr:EamA family transporter [Methanospirillum hungatei]
MTFIFLLLFLTVFFTGIGQVLLKIGAMYKGNKNDSIFTAYFNPYTIIAYGSILLVTIINVYILKIIPLKLLYAIASLNLVVIVLFSWLLLHEKVTLKKIGACILIFLGIIIFNIPW